MILCPLKPFTTVTMILTIVVLALAIVFFVSGKVRSDIVALGALITLMIFGVLTPSEGLSGFSNSIVVMMIGLFVVGGGIFQTGLANIVSNRILKLAGNRPFALYLLVMLTTVFLGSFVSNTGTVAVMLPIVVSLAAGAKMSASRLLMPLAFASSLGGMMTLIGTPPNLVINDELIKNGYEGLSFFSFSSVGIICVILGVAALWPLSNLFLSKKEIDDKGKKKAKSVMDLANEYQISENLYRLRVRKSSSLVFKSARGLDIANNYHINILEIRRKEEGKKSLFAKSLSHKMADPNTVIFADDVLYVMGSFENIKLFAEKYKLAWIEVKDGEEGIPSSEKFAAGDIGIAEVVILSNSMLVNQKVKDSGFREKYRVNILGIQRRNKYILKYLKEEKIQSGGVLLVQGKWKDIEIMREKASEFVIIGHPDQEASKALIVEKAPLAALILAAMVAAMVFNLLPAVTSVMLAALLMILTGCLHNVEEAYKTINWESIVLIGAMLPMSIALEKTGISIGIANLLVDNLGSFGPGFLLGGIYLATSALTMFISNSATAVLFAPIAMQSAIEMGVSPYPMLFAVTVAASMCFASPFSTPPNALVMSAGRYKFMDYVKVGLPVQILFAVVMIIVLPLIWPF
ncbi:MAG: SLC13 family permease [Bacteroidales bacterium]|nr:SLC13 family permease [Bacteroidales bacterium]